MSRFAAPARMSWRTQLPDALAAMATGFARTSLALIVLALAASLAPAGALDFPARAGRVVDEVGLIDLATRGTITRRLDALELATGDQVMVVVVDSLRGTDIDTFDRALSRHWGLGGAEGRGAVLVLAPHDGKIGLHAGDALGDRLTRAVMDRIFEQSVVPAFARHDAAGGLLQATDDIVAALTGARPPSPSAAAPAAPAPQVAQAAPDTNSQPALAHFPALTGRVVDEAGILGARRELTDRLAALEARTTDQLVVAAVRSLRGQTIEEYANDLFRDWKLGQKDKNNGVLLLVAPNERKVRIEVGYGLEGVLTDALTRIIIEQSILPRFKANDMAGGVAGGVDDIIRILTEDPVEAKRRAEAAGKPSFFTAVILPPLQAVGAFAGTALIMAAFALMAVMLLGVAGFVAIGLVVNLLVWLHVLPQAKNRTGRWTWLNTFNSGAPHVRHSGSSGSSSGSSSWSSSSASDSSSSGSSDSFSGGGGDSGGGGSSGSW